VAEIVQRNRNTGFILSEANGNYSREVVTLLGGFTGATSLEAGTLLGKITASDKYVISPMTGSDGSEISCAVLMYATDISDGDVDDAVVIARNAEVNGNLLVFDPSVSTDADKRTKCRRMDVQFSDAPAIVVRAAFMD
jgi:hypothetical protein